MTGPDEGDPGGPDRAGADDDLPRFSATGVPLDADTTDLRSGAPLHDDLLALLPLIGVWEGAGDGRTPDGDDFRYLQRIEFAHDGRRFLTYDARSWLVDQHDAIRRPAMRESGFWRPGRGPDDVEAVVALGAGLVLLFEGQVGELRWELGTTEIAATPTAGAVGGARRLYALVDGDLAYAQELAPPGGGFVPHLSARLRRVHPA